MRKNPKPVVLDELNEFFSPERRIETDPRKLCITPIRRSKPRKKKPRKDA